MKDVEAGSIHCNSRLLQLRKGLAAGDPEHLRLGGVTNTFEAVAAELDPSWLEPGRNNRSMLEMLYTFSPAKAASLVHLVHVGDVYHVAACNHKLAAARTLAAAGLTHVVDVVAWSDPNLVLSDVPVFCGPDGDERNLDVFAIVQYLLKASSTDGVVLNHGVEAAAAQGATGHFIALARAEVARQKTKPNTQPRCVAEVDGVIVMVRPVEAASSASSKRFLESSEKSGPVASQHILAELLICRAAQALSLEQDNGDESPPTLAQAERLARGSSCSASCQI